MGRQIVELEIADTNGIQGLRTRMREAHTDGGGATDSLIRVRLSHPCAKSQRNTFRSAIPITFCGLRIVLTHSAKFLYGPIARF